MGAGAFFVAAKTIAKAKGIDIRLAGVDADPAVLEQGLKSGLEYADIEAVNSLLIFGSGLQLISISKRWLLSPLRRLPPRN